MYKYRSKKALMRGTASAVAVAVVIGSASAQQPVSVNIESQPLPRALIAFNEQTGIAVAAPHDLVENVNVQAISGTMVPDAALALMLEGTNLQANTLSHGAMTISASATEAMEPRGNVLQTAELVEQTPAAAGGEGTRQLPAIIVTATKREEGIQDVPISVTALTSQTLEDLGATRFSDLSLANFNFDEGYGASLAPIAVRGIWQDLDGRASLDHAVGVYIDGVYAGLPALILNMDTNEIERIELLRGPQGTLFGKNATAGAINVVTKAPENDFGGRVEVGVGNFDQRLFRGTLNVPIAKDVLLARASVGRVTRDGYVTHVNPASIGAPKGGNIDLTSARFQLLYTPVSNFSSRLSVDYLDDPRRRYQPESTIDDPTGVTGDLIPYTTHGDPGFENQRNLGISLTSAYDFADGHTLTAVTGWRKDSTIMEYDVDYAPENLIRSIIEQDQKILSQEIRLTSPAYDRFDYVVGAYWLSQTTEREQDFDPVFGMQATTRGVVDANSWAAFAHGNFHLTDRLSAFAGARYTRENKEMDYVASGSAVGPLGLLEGYTDDRTWEQPTWTVGLQYQLTEDIMTYGSVATGFKSGGFNDTAVTADTADFVTVDPETVTSYEVGIKSSLFGNRVTANFSTFLMRYEDMQIVSSFTDFSSGSPVLILALQNAAEIESKGFEFEIAARVTDDFSFSTAIGYADSEYKDFPGALDSNGAVVNAAGNKVAQIPKITFGANARYEREIPIGGSMFVDGDVRYVDERFTDGVINTPEGVLPSYTLLNARIGYISPDQLWRLTFWGRNLGDSNQKFYFGSNSFTGLPTVQQKHLEPRTWGVALSVDF